uniref:Cysteine desulfurase n=1 Tax=Haptolina ericina TaxID=156174 RepID=A0A7S3EYG3_9EUKA|mmetsp:Transcript_3661/g.7988  ORF Transcript_3661/g.7988 Transcript_3661/m.7988 type:complete len:122 (+) Transcript_3661:1145-1510(+)
MGATRDRLASLLIEGLGSDFVRINGPSDPENRLPNTLSIGLRGVQASTLLANISDQLAASAGAACHTTSHASVSAVLRAMEVPLEFAVGTLRLSSGRHTSMDEIEKAAKLIITEVVRQRNA